MRATSIYPSGPERRDSDPLTDAAEVRAARSILQQGRANAKPEFSQRPVRIAGIRIIDPARRVTPEEFLALGPEQLDSHEEYEAARDRERWGDDPFGED